MGVRAPVLGSYGYRSPLAGLDKRPDALGHSVHSEGYSATSPAPPSVLYQCGRPNPVQSPEAVREKVLWKGRSPRKSPRSLFHERRWASLSKAGTSVTPGGWCRSQLAPVFLASLWVGLQGQGTGLGFQLEEPWAMCSFGM